MRSRPPSRGQPQVNPVIKEILRTCVHPPSILLRVERIVEQILPRIKDELLAENEGQSGGSRQQTVNVAHRLVLGDGELLIQALLSRPLHPLLHSGAISQGSIVEVKSFSVKRANRTSGDGKVVYLGISELIVVGATKEELYEAEAEVEAEVEAELEEGGFIRDGVNEMANATVEREHLEDNPPTSLLPQITPSTRNAPTAPSPMESNSESDSDSDSEGFETSRIDTVNLSQRRRILKQLTTKGEQIEEQILELPPTDQSRKRRRSSIESHDQRSTTTESEKATASNFHLYPNHDHVAQTDPIVSGKSPISHPADPPRIELTALASLLKHRDNSTSNIPPNPDFSPLHNILAIVCHVSPNTIHKSFSAFPPKRHIKIIDTSLMSMNPTTSSAAPSSSPSLLSRIQHPTTTTAATTTTSIRASASAQAPGMTLAVFVDANTFTPAAGTVALMRGLKVQRWRGETWVNIYPDRGEKRGDAGAAAAARAAAKEGKRQKWFIDGEEELRELGLGQEVEKLRRLWNEIEGERRQ